MSSTSRGSSGLTPTFRRASAGRPRTPARTRFPELAASSAFDSPSSDRNGRTVAYRFASAARRAGDLFHRRPQRGHVQVRFLLLDQLHFTTEASSIPSCPARRSITGHGASSGSSGRNRPM
ncbi:hypothetical protein WAB15_37665 [Streptomyces sirii]|uniref:Uncharacterized protein n=1 Tax=Streptomyces sirii TaxID=3127701 RepID=A0ABZ2QXI9_9ACTN